MRDRGGRAKSGVGLRARNARDVGERVRFVTLGDPGAAGGQTPAKAHSSPVKAPPLPPPQAPVAFPNAAEAALAAEFGFTSAPAWLQHRRVELGQDGFATVPRPARPDDHRPRATSPGRLEQIQRQIDAELAADPPMAARPKKVPPPLPTTPTKSAPTSFSAKAPPPPPLSPADEEIDRLHVAAAETLVEQPPQR